MTFEATVRARRPRPGYIARALAAGAVLALLSTLAPETRASGGPAPNPDASVIATVIAEVAADVSFGVYDLVMWADERDVDKNAAALQFGVTGVKTIFLHVVTSKMAHDGEDGAVLALTIPTMIGAALATHGIWSYARPDTRHSTLMLGSTLIGIDEAFGAAALSYAVLGEPSPTALAVGQVVTGVPSLVAASALVGESDEFRSGWMLVAVWSGLVLTHGAVSLGLSAAQDDGHDAGRAAPPPSRADAAVGAPAGLALVPSFGVAPDGYGGVTASVGAVGVF